MHKNIGDFIGNTPLVRLQNLEQAHGLQAAVYGKLESRNPAGSVKDRIAKAMLDDAEEKGYLHKGAVLIEPTSGNTGIALAALAAVRGYRIILTMPETMSMERRSLLAAYGAEIVLTDGSAGMRGAIEEAERLAGKYPGSFIPGQFDNPANPKAHYETTGPEIWRDTEGKVDLLIAGVGTGGTITGTGRYLKEKKPKTRIIAVEPAESQVLAGKPAGPHSIQGIGANFVPAVLDTSLLDAVVAVKSEAAFAAARQMAKTDGILCGISAGAALYAAIQIAEQAENRGKTIVVILPDGGEKYMSTDLFR